MEIQKLVIPYLKHLGFKRKNVSFIPVSGLEGVNLTRPSSDETPWYKGPTLLQFLSCGLTAGMTHRFGQQNVCRFRRGQYQGCRFNRE